MYVPANGIVQLAHNDAEWSNYYLNSLWPSDTIWRHKSGSKLARHQAITWTNVDLSSGRSSGIHLRAILQELPQPPVTEISLKITYSKFCSNLPGANELNMISFQVNLSTNGPG